MNSDKFDRVVLDLLYDELDELTALAARRHMEQSARAREIFAHLKATRRLSVLPVLPAPEGFEQSVLVREPGARAEFPLRQRIGRYVSMTASYAMRPQLAMGVLLLLMIGSSLLFLRARPGHHGAIQVTERGVPEAEAELVVPVADVPSEPTAEPSSAAPPSALATSDVPTLDSLESPPPAVTSQPAVALAVDPSAESASSFDDAVRAYRAGHYVQAQRLFDRLGKTGGPRAAEAALYAAQSTRHASGCAAAVSRFQRVRSRYPASGVANEALWRAGKCQQKLGDRVAARQSFETLLHVPAYARDARRSLLELDGKSEQASGPSDHPIGIESEAALDATGDAVFIIK
ncbi:MAG: tetratricopeptide repeat protein [Polyangiaceae bacterium]